MFQGGQNHSSHRIHRPSSDPGVTPSGVSQVSARTCWVGEQRSRGRREQGSMDQVRTSNNSSRYNHNSWTSPSTFRDSIYSTYSPRQALSRQDRHTAKLYFKLLQAVHHLEHIEHAIDTGTHPPGMLKQIQKLTNVMKPSSPTPQIHRLIEKNTIEWMNKNLDILLDHYEATIAELIIVRKSLLAFKVASNWTTKRYGHRLHPNTLSRTYTLLFLTEDSAPTSPSSFRSLSPSPSCLYSPVSPLTDHQKPQQLEIMTTSSFNQAPEHPSPPSPTHRTFRSEEEEQAEPLEAGQTINVNNKKSKPIRTHHHSKKANANNNLVSGTEPQDTPKKTKSTHNLDSPEHCLSFKAQNSKSPKRVGMMNKMALSATLTESTSKSDPTSFNHNYNTSQIQHQNQIEQKKELPYQITHSTKPKHNHKGWKYKE